MSTVVSLSDRRHSKRLSVDLDEGQHRHLRQSAVDGDVTVAHIIRALVAAFEHDSTLRESVLTAAKKLKQEERRVS